MWCRRRRWTSIFKPLVWNRPPRRKIGLRAEISTDCASQPSCRRLGRISAERSKFRPDIQTPRGQKSKGSPSFGAREPKVRYEAQQEKINHQSSLALLRPLLLPLLIPNGNGLLDSSSSLQGIRTQEQTSPRRGWTLDIRGCAFRSILVHSALKPIERLETKSLRAHPPSTVRPPHQTLALQTSIHPHRDRTSTAQAQAQAQAHPTTTRTTALFRDQPGITYRSRVITIKGSSPALNKNTHELHLATPREPLYLHPTATVTAILQAILQHATASRTRATKGWRRCHYQATARRAGRRQQRATHHIAKSRLDASNSKRNNSFVPLKSSSSTPPSSPQLCALRSSNSLPKSPFLPQFYKPHTIQSVTGDTAHHGSPTTPHLSQHHGVLHQPLIRTPTHNHNHLRRWRLRQVLHHPPSRPFAMDP